MISRETLGRISRQYAVRNHDESTTYGQPARPYAAPRTGLAALPQIASDAGPTKGSYDTVKRMSPKSSTVPARPEYFHRRRTPRKAYRKSSRRLGLWLTIAALVLVFSGAAIWFAWRMDVPGRVFNRLGRTFDTPKPDATVELPSEVIQGTPLQIGLTGYDHQLNAVTVSILNADKELVFGSGKFVIDPASPSFSVSINTASLEPGSYSVDVLDQNGGMLRKQTLKIRATGQ